ncbi:MAG TPA: thiosulfate oxidation carrier protein SoxY [Devosia sp.]|nr:thiosulfate oxidation carrier protein SoxY [Devosia sp.]
MNLSRRRALVLGGAAISVTLIPLEAAIAGVEETRATIDAFTGGAELLEGDITLTIPELVENGNMVPVSVAAPGALSIMLLGDDNPVPEVMTLNFGELSGSSEASVRIRLAGTQNVIAVAKMPDGTFISTAREVGVTIGGCGSS